MRSDDRNKAIRSAIELMECVDGIIASIINGSFDRELLNEFKTMPLTSAIKSLEWELKENIKVDKNKAIEKYAEKFKYIVSNEIAKIKQK